MEFSEYFNQYVKQDKIYSLNLFYGEEIYYIDNTISFIESHYLNPLYQSLNLTQIEDSLDVDALGEIMSTVPFFDERRVILIKNSGIFKQIKEDQEKKIIDLFDNIPSHIILIFNEREIDKRKKIYKKVTKKGAEVNFKKLSPNELLKWVKKKFSTYNKEIAPNILTYFIGMLDYNNPDKTMSLYEVEHLINTIVNNNGEIDKVVINQYLEVPIEQNIFKMIDAISNNQMSKAILTLNSIMSMGEPAIKVFFLISNQFRNIHKTKLLLTTGYSSAAVASKLAIHPFAAKKAAQFANQMTMRTLDEIMDILSATDHLLKSTGLNGKLLLEKCFLEISMVMNQKTA